MARVCRWSKWYRVGWRFFAVSTSAQWYFTHVLCVPVTGRNLRISSQLCISGINLNIPVSSFKYYFSFVIFRYEWISICVTLGDLGFGTIISQWVEDHQDWMEGSIDAQIEIRLQIRLEFCRCIVDFNQKPSSIHVEHNILNIVSNVMGGSRGCRGCAPPPPPPAERALFPAECALFLEECNFQTKISPRKTTRSLHKTKLLPRWNGQGHCAHLLWRNRKISSVDRRTYDKNL
jgi:hypothetical protein